MFLKMFVAIKAIKKNQGIMMVAINDMKRQQVGLRNKITQANAEIQVIKELINNNYQTAKKEITIDKTFIVPKMGIGRVVSAVALEKSCKNSTYCDQLVSARCFHLGSLNFFVHYSMRLKLRNACFTFRSSRFRCFRSNLNTYIFD